MKTAPQAKYRAGMRELLLRRFLFGELYKRHQEWLRRYPQMCGYAFDAVSLHLSIDGRYEREELELITSRFHEQIAGRTVLDVGANIGNHALAFAQTAARVVALEPHPISFRLLEINVRNHPNVTALNVGASDRRAKLQAGTPPGNAGGCSIGGHQNGDAVELEVQPVDELGLSDVGLVKIDIEGHEEQALRGMQALLGAQRPVIVFEQKADVISDGTSNSLDLIRAAGYAYFYSIERRLPWRFPLGRAGHLVEAMLRGVPAAEAYLVPLARLEKRDYACLVASPAPV
jgi:FkbM family methyltransferase